MFELNQAELLRENLRLLVRKLGVLERGEASCCGITMSQCHTIVEIGKAGGMSVNVLAGALGLDKSTVSRSVDKLVSDGIIVRRADPDDRRYVTLRLSDKGQSIFEQMEKRMAEYFEEVAAALPGDKREQIVESLGYLAQALKDSRCC